MQVNPGVAETVSLLGESSRAAILTALMDDRFHTATELAFMAGIKQQTASFHLSKLVKAEWIVMEKHGRHRYYRLAGQEIAETLESVLALSKPPEIRSLRQSSQLKALKAGRTCYDHLAGEIGVKVTESLVKNGHLEKMDRDFTVTGKGKDFFAGFGLDLNALQKNRRAFSRTCLDWSERKHHLAGALGKALTENLFERKWIEKKPESRAVKVTETGRAGFAEIFRL
jgi:DNA-binding transcriptional ArsR family regulator